MSHILINCTWKESTVSLYFRLLWYHSILRDSIDLKHTKRAKFEDKTVKSTLLSLVPVGPPWFPDLSRRYGACVKRGREKHIFGVSLFRPSRQSNISTLGEERFKYPLPWENKISQMPYPRANKDNQIPTPCPASPPLPAGMTLIGA